MAIFNRRKQARGVNRHTRDTHTREGHMAFEYLLLAFYKELESSSPQLYVDLYVDSSLRIPAEIDETNIYNLSTPEIYTAMCRYLTKTYGCGHKLRTTSPTSSLCIGMSPKVHPSGSEFSYRKFEEEETPCPTCTTSEEHRKLRRCRASEVQNRNAKAMGAQEAEAIVSCWPLSECICSCKWMRFSSAPSGYYGY